MWSTFVRRHLVSIGILVLATGLGGYLYFVDRGAVSSGEAEARKRNLLKAFRRNEITELVIDHSGDVIHISKRTDDAGDAMYYLDGGELADQSAVDKTLSALEFATTERRLDEPIDRKALGLDPPNTRIVLTMGSLTLKFAIGGPAPALPGAAYAEVFGDGVSVVSRDLVAELAEPRGAYRGKTLIPYLSTSLAEMTLEGAGGTRRLVVGSWGGWGIKTEGQRAVRADRNAFDGILTALAEVRADSFPSEGDAERALGGATDKVRLTLVPRAAASPRAVLEVGGACPGHPESSIAVRSEPAPKTVACVPKGATFALATPLERLTDLHLFSLRPDEMEEIALGSGGQELQVARSGAAWHMRAPTEGMVDGDVGQAFARTLSGLTAERVRGAGPDAPGAPGEHPKGWKSPTGDEGSARGTARITKVGAGEDAPNETIEIGPDAAEGRVEVRRATDGAVLEVTRDVAQALVPSSFALRSRKVIDEQQVTRVSIEAPSVHQVLRRSSVGVWTIEEPKGLAPDPGIAGDVAEALSQLRADRWVADRDDGSYGLAAPRGRYQIDVEGGAIRVETGRATSGGVFARRLDREGVFVLPTATERTLETWAVDRSYFMVDPNDVRQIRIDRAGDHVTLEGAHPGEPDAGSAAERFENARRLVGELRAEGLVHPRAARKDEGFDKPLATVTIQRKATTLKFIIGRGDAWRDTNVFYARRDGVDATFAIAQSKVRPLLDLR